MTKAEQREILEAVARDPKTYPRDKINAVKALIAMDKEDGVAPESKEKTPESELDELIAA